MKPSVPAGSRSSREFGISQYCDIDMNDGEVALRREQQSLHDGTGTRVEIVLDEHPLETVDVLLKDKSLHGSRLMPDDWT